MPPTQNDNSREANGYQRQPRLARFELRTERSNGHHLHRIYKQARFPSACEIRSDWVSSREILLIEFFRVPHLYPWFRHLHLARVLSALIKLLAFASQRGFSRQRPQKRTCVNYHPYRAPPYRESPPRPSRPGKAAATEDHRGMDGVDSVYKMSPRAAAPEVVRALEPQCAGPGSLQAAEGACPVYPGVLWR